MHIIITVISSILVFVVLTVMNKKLGLVFPLALIVKYLVFIVLFRAVVDGLLLEDWGYAAFGSATTCIAVYVHLKYTGTLEVYRTEKQARLDAEIATNTAPEDDPNWSNYRP